jgi:hypothetical protein
MLNILILLPKPENRYSAYYSGYKPLAVQRHLQITANFQDRFTEDLIDAVTNAKQMPMKQVGIEWAIQSRELKAAGVPVLLFDG